MEPCIANVFLSTTNEMQRYTMFCSLDRAFFNYEENNQQKRKHVLSTIVQMLDVITSFNFNCYSPMMD
jgi:hypothetical protein